MAVKKNDSSTPVKKPIAEVRKENDELHAQIEKLENGAYCYICGKHKGKEHFYQSSDPNVKSGIVPVCKKCAYDIACKKDESGKYHDPTKASVMAALEYIDKPFFTKLWDSSYYEYMNPSSKHRNKNIWTAYIKNISMPQYVGLRWKDGDVFKTNANLGELNTTLPSSEENKIMQKKMEERKEQEQEYQKCRHDVIKFYGYDPFEYEDDADKPLLYAKVSRMLDMSGDEEDDQIKMSSVIEIVRGYLQLDKIDRQISILQNNPSSHSLNELKSLQQFASSKVSAINALAKESKLSKSSSDNTTKGTNTWTGKVKELRELNLREQEVNMFEVQTCKGMQQVAELSDAAILKQIGLDENDYTDMIKEQRMLITKLRNEKNLAEERQRILYRENSDLKDLLRQKNIGISEDLESNMIFAPDFGKQEEVSENESE